MLDDVLAPVPYEWWWVLVGVGLLLGAAGVVVVGVLLSREAAPVAPVSLPSPAGGPAEDPVNVIRDRALRRIGALEQRHAAGELDDRQLHLELRAELRAFAQDRTGLDLGSATVSMLATSPETRRLADEFERMLAPTFAARSRHRVNTSLNRARRLVRKW
ncbi:hypothetical protein BJH93_05790 [Kocuria polaris]|nr:hypothetical protein [Kocuria polaris]